MIRYTLVLKDFQIFFSYYARIAQQYIKSFDFAQHCGAYAALSSAEHYEKFLLIFHCSFYLILSVTNVKAANRMPTIQKRIVIFDSGIPFTG